MTKIALIGASNNPDKFGNKILLDLVSKGYVVYPVNHKNKVISGIKSFENISDITESIDIVNFVVQSEVTLKILQKHKKFLINKQIWCQPGSSDKKVKDFLIKNHFMNYILDDCIMLKR